jgi:hypothetical protein
MSGVPIFALSSPRWAYDGWNNLTWSPQARIPRTSAGLIGTVVMAIYLLANVAYLHLPAGAVAMSRGK